MCAHSISPTVTSNLLQLRSIVFNIQSIIKHLNRQNTSSFVEEVADRNGIIPLQVHWRPALSVTSLLNV